MAYQTMIRKREVNIGEKMWLEQVTPESNTGLKGKGP